MTPLEPLKSPPQQTPGDTQVAKRQSHAPENYHLNVKKLPKTWSLCLFFLKKAIKMSFLAHKKLNIEFLAIFCLKDKQAYKQIWAFFVKHLFLWFFAFYLFIFVQKEFPIYLQCFCVISLQSYREMLKKYRKRAITL